MKTYWLIVAVLLLNLSLLLINDYFPGTLAELGIPSWILFVVIVLMVVFSWAAVKPRREKKRYMIIFPALMVGVPLVVMAVLTALGGESQNSLSLASPAVWIGAVLAIWISWLEYTRASEKKAEKA